MERPDSLYKRGHHTPRKLLAGAILVGASLFTAHAAHELAIQNTTAQPETPSVALAGFQEPLPISPQQAEDLSQVMNCLAIVFATATAVEIVK